MAARRHALWALAGVSFAESSFFPIPPDILLIPMVIANRARAWLIAGVCTVASVAGGAFGYAIGFFLFATVGQRLLDLYHLNEKFSTVQGWYNEYDVVIVFAAGLTPLPYKLFTIAGGATEIDLIRFLAVSLVARGIRFYVEAALLWWLGEPIRRFLERNLQWVTAGFVVLLVGGFVVLRLVA